VLVKIDVIAQGVGAQFAGAVKALFNVKLHAVAFVKKAVTLTLFPFDVKFVKVTVCGLVPTVNV
jgi:hypothetical protein